MADRSGGSLLQTDTPVITEDRVCPGCKGSVMSKDGGVVVAFGQSLFHVDCFKCAKCNNQVTADTNLLLLSDGSPVCANCSYCCNVCEQPILDEAIMTGNDSYHAHCFKCKVCKKRIEELVFAKTSQGIYCMDCHSERVARSRRHHERREKERKEREKERRTAAEVVTTTNAGGSARAGESSYKGPSNETSPPASDPGVSYASPQNNASLSSRHNGVITSGQPTTPRSSDFGSLGTRPLMTQRGSSSSSVREDHHNALNPAQSSTPRPRSPSVVHGPSPNQDHMRSYTTPISNMNTLGVTSDDKNLPLHKRKSFDDRPLNIVATDEVATNATTNGQSGLLIPDGSIVTRKEKRRSINPGLAMSFNNIPPAVPQNGSPTSSPSTPSQSNTHSSATPPVQGRDYSRVSSPLREQFPMEVTMSPPTLAKDTSNDGPGSNPPYLTLESSNTTTQDKHINGRSRSASSSGYPNHADSHMTIPEHRERSRSPMRPSITLDRVPVRTSSRTDHRNETTPPIHGSDSGHRTPQLTGQGRMSPSLSVPNGTPPLLRHRSFDDRQRLSTSSLGQSIELPARQDSCPTSPSHRVDVPHGIESGTDTEAEGEEEYSAQNETVHGSLPPLPPPKEGKGAKVGTRPPQLKLDTSHVEEHDTADTSNLDSEDLSEDFSHEEPIRSTSHATFIAPALPPIRFSMGGADFSDLLRSVGGQDSLRYLDQVAEGKESKLKVDITPPPSVGSDTTVIDSNASMDATPVKRRDLSNHNVADLTVRQDSNSRSRTPSPSPRPSMEFRKTSIDNSSDSSHRTNSSRPSAELSAMERARSFSDTKGLRPSLDGRPRQRERFDSNASLGPTRITVTSPENSTSKLMRSDTSELVRLRLQEALADTNGRGSTHVKLDVEFVGAIMTLLEQRKEEYDDMKRRLDGMKRTSQQYMDGLTVAQTEYDRELKARRDAEAEVTRLRVLLSGQAVRLTAISGETRRQEAQKLHSQELSQSLSSLERDLAKLQVERDMTLAEVEELSASKSSPILSNDDDSAIKLSRALSVRFDNIKNQYQHELLPLTTQRETLLRELSDLRVSRDAFLEETTMLNARNEELAQLNAQYVRRVEAATPDSLPQLNKRSDSLDRSRPSNLSSSVTSSTVAFSDESSHSNFVKISKPDNSETPAPQVLPRSKFMGIWSGTRAQSQAPKENLAVNGTEANKGKPRAEHSFQQISVLRVARCDHCGDKMWGSQLRCSNCNVAVHIRCVHQVHLACSQQQNQGRDEPLASSLTSAGPSMFGRDLSDQVRSDSKDEQRLIPVIVEKCIDAVDVLALDYEGIYRKTGGSGQSKTITQLFERGDYASFDLRDNDRFNDICSVTSVLKTYFRSLPDPLLTYALHEQFIAASTMKDPAMKSSALTELVAELPREHYHTTRALMLHLHRIYERSDRNLMHARNLGVVFGPTLMRSRDPNAEFTDMAGKALTVEWLVENAPTVFEQFDALDIS